tara:strand:+ start:75 stop:902 length:828 start_codon:yes stop_codon:yes gene_type:complete
MCGNYGQADSNKDGDINLADWFTDIQDGGGPGRSGARFSGAGVGALDVNKDNYISEAEYLSGEKHSISNKERGISGPDDGPIGYAYDNRDNFISRISNTIGALPRGSIASEAALGPEGTDIKTDGLARFMQGGAFFGALGRGLTGTKYTSPEYVSPDQGDMTPEEYDRAIVKSFNSMGNTGEEPVPQEVAAAMGRVRGLNPRAVSVGSSIGPVSLPREVVTAGKMYERGEQFDENFPSEALGNVRVNSITGNVEVLGPSGEVLSIIPASDYNMQN